MLNFGESDDKMNKAEKLAAARKKLKEFQNQQRNKEIQGSSQVFQPHIPQSDIDSPSSRQAEVETVIPAEDAAKFYPQNVPVFASSNLTNSFIPQQPSLANYFQNSDRSELFFDVVHKPVNGDRNNDTALQTQTSTSNFAASKPSMLPAASSFFPPGPENTFSSIQSTLDVSNENTKGDQVYQQKCISNDQELNTLRLELQQAKSEIRMQKDALGIITAEKEDLQTKLIKAVQEIDLHERNVRLLNSQLEENIGHQKQLEVTVEDLKRFKDSVSSRVREFEQSLSDLKEKNDELYQNLETEKENNKTLQSQLDETRSSHSLLTLKFQQLGIEVDNFQNKDYKSAHEECELWKRKYDELENRLRATLYEKDRTEEEYRQYVLNLKEELENANAELRRLSDENQTLTGKISSQTEHIGSLERQLQKTPGDTGKDTTIAELMEEVQKLRIEKTEDVETIERLKPQLTENEALKKIVNDLEGQIENLTADMTNAQELQMAVESNKVAASQAIAQNTKLKDEFERLHQMVQILNEEKVMLSKMLEEEKTRNTNLTVNLQKNEQKNDNHEITTNDAAINTDAEEVGGGNGAYGKANVEAMLLLQEKFKSVLDRMADLTDEKQQLEHLVMQLQSETETIEEYVALYQKQRSVLQQRARETDLKMESVSQEKERLLNILRLILTTDNFDSAFVKQLVENNLSVELSEELANRGSTNSAIDQYRNSLYLPKNDIISHHPSCPCCSGQLITI